MLTFVEKIMGRKAIQIELQEGDSERIISLLKTGVHGSREILRANLVHLNAQGKTISELQTMYALSQPTVSRVLHRYLEGGLTFALADEPRSGAPAKLSPKIEAHVTALVCSSPPEGRVRWTLELLQNEMIQLNYVDTISDESIRTILKKVNSNRGWSTNGVLVT